MKPVLVDTSVWRYFFAGRASARPLATLLQEEGIVLVHPLVVGELVLGGLSSDQERLLQRLPTVKWVPYEEILSFIKRRRLARRGIGWGDAEIIASGLTSGAEVWSFDRAVVTVAGELGAAFDANVGTS
ncbi:MAG: PIN domain-containing protein [Polyangia bacterium]